MWSFALNITQSTLETLGKENEGFETEFGEIDNTSVNPNIYQQLKCEGHVTTVSVLH